MKDNKAKADAFRIRVLGIDAYDPDEHTLGFWEHVNGRRIDKGGLKKHSCRPSSAMVAVLLSGV